MRKGLEDETVKNVAQSAYTATPQATTARQTSDQIAAIQPGQASGQAPGISQSGGSPSGYIPLQQYLQANVGAGAGAANVLGSQIRKTTETGQQEIGGIKQAGETAAQKAQSDIEAKGKEISGALLSQPTANVETAKQFLTESYSGPEASPYAAQVTAAQKAAQEKLGLLKTESGKQTALTEAVKGPYAKSYGALDRYLLATDPTAKALLESKQKTAETSLGETGKAAESAIKSQIDIAKEKLKQQQEGIKQTAKSKKEAELGKAEEKLGRIDTTKYGFEEAAAPSYGDVLSEQQAADIEALAAITGENIGQDLRAKTYKEGRAPTPKGGFEPTLPGQIPTSSPQVKEKADVFGKLKEEVGKLKIPEVKLPSIKTPKW